MPVLKNNRGGLGVAAPGRRLNLAGVLSNFVPSCLTLTPDICLARCAGRRSVSRGRRRELGAVAVHAQRRGRRQREHEGPDAGQVLDGPPANV